MKKVKIIFLKLFNNFLFWYFHINSPILDEEEISESEDSVIINQNNKPKTIKKYNNRKKIIEKNSEEEKEIFEIENCSEEEEIRKHIETDEDNSFLEEKKNKNKKINPTKKRNTKRNKK